MSLDKSKILIGDDIVINEFITLKQPKIEDIIGFGQERFFNTFYSLCSIPSNFKAALWDLGLDWNEISDWELFINLSRGVTAEDTSLILGEIDLSSLMPMQNSETKEIVLASDNCIITEEVYMTFIGYIREMVGFVAKKEKAMNKLTKMALIEEDRLNKSTPSKKDDESFLFSAIISLVNTEEFPYTYNTVKEVTIYQLMKSFYQIQNKKAACALYQGSMSGFVDTSKIDKKAFQWTYAEH